MASRQANKSVQFFRAWALSDGRRRAVEPPQWREILTAWDDRVFAEKAIGGIYYIPDLTHRMPALGVHKEVNGAFQSYLDHEHAAVEDILDATTEVEGKVRANSTAVIFIPDTSYIAITPGNNSAPRHKSVEPFLEEICPLGDNEYWKVEPVIDSGKLKKFQTETVDGVTRVELRLPTTMDLLTPASPKGIAESIDSSAQTIGAELDVSITVSLKDEYRQSRSARQRLKQAVLVDIPRFTAARTVKVHPTDSSASDLEVLSLIAHRFTKEVEIAQADLASKRFANLVQATASAAHECEDELRALER